MTQVSTETNINGWSKLKSIPSTTMTAYYRFGMLQAAGGDDRAAGAKMKCLACYGIFESGTEAKSHMCPREAEFRLATGRAVGLSVPRRKIRSYKAIAKDLHTLATELAQLDEKIEERVTAKLKQLVSERR